MSEIHRNKILDLVKNIEHTHSVHVAVHTSEEASRVRGVPMSSGAKAIVLEGDKSKNTILVVIPAHRKVDFVKLKDKTGEKFHFKPSPFEAIGCVPGSVPPFGSVLGLQTFADADLEDVLNFNIGLLTESLQIKKQDYLNLENPILGNFSKE
jgi:prolyl-tRNA editing enzyme YbaK/EbsC (Cys-tRNA(Pro) deacylase)